VIRRVLLVAGLLATGLMATIGVELFVLSRREYLPTDPGCLIDARVEPASTATGSALRIAVLGDSTVAGVGSPTERESLPVLIAQRVADGLDRPVEVVGFGVSGARTGTVLAEQLPRLEAPWDAVVIVIGSNDATHATPWPDLRRQTRAMLQRAADMSAVVVLAGAPRFSGNGIIPEPLRTMVDRYAGVLAGEQRAAAASVPAATFVDIAADASPRFAGRPDATSSDGFHPSPVGYGFWADSIALGVIEGLGGA
jgi:lysophospholipase L1-like esterase